MKLSKQQRYEHNLTTIRQKGYNPVKQGTWYHFKDDYWNFYPTTGKCYNDATHQLCKVDELPNKTSTRLTKQHDSTPKKYRYCKLDTRYLPDWVLAPKRQEWLKTVFPRLSHGTCIQDTSSGKASS